MTEEFKIKGYASTYGRDLSGDIVMPGAFAESLADKTTYPMLMSHNTKEPIGVWDKVVEDEKGLYVEGRLFAGQSSETEKWARLVKSGAVTGLSIGYRAQKSFTNEHGSRKLHTIDLWEISVVAFPMNRECRIELYG